MFGIMGFVSKIIQKHMHQDDVSDKVIGTKAEVEVDVGG